MLILSNCLTDKPDEGCLNVAVNIAKRIKSKYPETELVTYERSCSFSDRTLKLNKFFFNKSLFKEARKTKKKILYIPFPARGSATALRIFMLSLFAKEKINVLLTMKIHMDFFPRFLFRISGAKLLVLTEDAVSHYGEYVHKDRITRVKAGVDTKRFTVADKEKVKQLKEKYGFSPDSTVILHTGHLNRGRNIGELLRIDEKYQVLLVVSTLTKNEQDKALREELLKRKNIRIIDEYVEKIEEIYQLCDVYFFPTAEEGRCIDIPLSCMEAAACNKPIITTDFGGMKAFKGKEGYSFIEDINSYNPNDMIEALLNCGNIDTRSAVLDYDWDGAVDFIKNNT